MSFTQVLLIIAGSFVAVIVLVSIVLFWCRRFHFAVSFALAHGIFISLLLVGYMVSKPDAQSQLFWIAPALIDVPVSLVLLFMKPRQLGVEGVSLVLLIVGTAQYYFIGRCLDLLLAKRRRRHVVKTDKKKTLGPPPSGSTGSVL